MTDTLVEAPAHKRTFGEQLLTNLVRKLPKDSYFAVEQPKLIDRDGLSWKPDYAIVCSRLGVLIVEIKDWVSIVEANREEVTIQRQDGSFLTLPNPVNTAQNYAYVLADMFQQREELMGLYRGVRRLAFPWHYAVALPNLSRRLISQIEESLVWEPGVTFSRDELKSPDAFKEAIEYLPWRFSLKHPMNSDTLDVIRGVLCPSVRIITPQGDDIGTETANQTLLIQEKLPAPALPGFEDTLHVRLLRGVAGSGKTLVLIRRALYLREQYSNHRILVLTFNRDLSEDLKARINHSDIEVMDFHQLCFKINGFVRVQKIKPWLEKHAGTWMADAGLAVDFVAEEIAWRKEMELFDNEAYLNVPRAGRGASLTRAKREAINRIFSQYLDHQAQHQSWVDWEDIPRLALDNLQADNSDLRHSYDVILIDEAQDFAPIWLKVIREALKPGGLLFLCDDPTQSLFRAYSWKQKGVDVVGCTKILRVPFRSTRQISQAAHALIQADPTLRQSDEITAPNFEIYSLATGPMPNLIACADTHGEVALVQAEVERCLREGVERRDMAVLCPERWQLDHWQAVEASGVYVNTYGKMKGLEFKAVFLPHLHDLFEPGAADEGDGTTQRRKLFTAMTRPRETLVMTYCGSLPSALAALEPFVVQEALTET